MELKKIFKKDIARPINGVVKADQTENETVFVELDEYVITNELMKHIEKFFGGADVVRFALGVCELKGRLERVAHIGRQTISR